MPFQFFLDEPVSVTPRHVMSVKIAQIFEDLSANTKSYLTSKVDPYAETK